MLRLIIPIVIALQLICTPNAAALSGENLLIGLREVESTSDRDTYSFSAGVSLGFVSGIVNYSRFLEASGAARILCFGDTNMSSYQLVAIVRKYIEARPESWHVNAESLVFAAFNETFPCEPASAK